MTEWWRTAVTYQVYVSSFCDSDGDGVGDLRGVRSKLAYIADLGADAIWLTPFYRSPMADHGYDVADHCDVDPLFGTLDEFDRLLADAHRLGLKVLVDVVPNHTSSQHPWFVEALAAPVGSPVRDRYLFRDPKPDGSPPNNWTSVFGGPAWTLDAPSGQHYLHLFASEQPDLNWRHQEVHDEMDRVVRFWLDRGVDGFRIDVAHGLYKHPELLDDEGPHAAAGVEDLQFRGLDRQWNQPEVHGVYRRWRQMCDRYPGQRMMVGEVFLFDPDAIARYVGADELHQAFNFTLMGSPLDAASWKGVIDLELERIRSGTWVLSSHDVPRHATRYGGGVVGRRRALAASLTMLALPGAAYLYQGEELALEDALVPIEQRQDPLFHRSGGAVGGRDGCRAPIPWTSSGPGYGFTTGQPWLPFSVDAAERSVERQANNDASPLDIYRRALAERRALRGELEWIEAPPGCLAFQRDRRQFLLNLSESSAAFDVGDRAVRVASEPNCITRDARLLLPAGAAAWVW